MNPFDIPPHGDPLNVDPPADGGAGRGRMVLVALLTAGLIGGGIVGVSALASADRPESAAATPDTLAEPTDEPTDEQTDDDPAPTDDGDDSDPNDDRDGDHGDTPGDHPDIDGEIVIDMGGDEPLVVDLGEFDEGTFEQLSDCIGLPRYGEFDAGDFDLGEFGELPLEDLQELFEDLPFDPEDFEDFGEFGEFEIFDGTGGSVTVTGPDGVSVIDLGENGSVTISKDGDDVSIDTSGDATVTELEELFGDLPFDLDANWEELDGDLQLRIDEFLEGMPNVGEFDELPEFDLPATEDIQRCVDEVLGN